MPSRILFPIKRRDVALMALLFFGLIPGSTWTQETPAAKEFEQNLEPLADAELLGDWRAYQHAISQGKGSIAFFTERGPKRAEAWKRLAEGNSAMGMVLVGNCYQTGIGVAKDEKKAFATFTDAGVKELKMALQSYSKNLPLLRRCRLKGHFMVF